MTWVIHKQYIKHMGCRKNILAFPYTYVVCVCIHVHIHTYMYTYIHTYTGFPGGSVVKNTPANEGDTGLIPGLG